MPSESDVKVAVMAALELALDVAYQDGPTARDLAIASEAYREAGYYDEAATSITHATRDEIVVAIDKARYARRRALLKADGRRMLATFRMLAEQGVITWGNCSEAKRQRWLSRGGHDRERQ